MAEHDFFQENCAKFDYSVENGLILKPKEGGSQEYIYSSAKNKVNLDAIYFLKQKNGAEVPLIFFKKLYSYDEDLVSELHRKVWNMGSAPLLYVILPTSVRIYSSYEPPSKKGEKLDPLSGLIAEIDVLKAHDVNYLKFSRLNVVSEEYWANNKNFNREKKVQQMLLNNIKYMRNKLINGPNKIDSNIVHSLLIRAIFIKYLEDRKDKIGNNVFPRQYFNDFKQGANHFIDLLPDVDATYDFFNELEKKYGGDIFNILPNETKIITTESLIILKKLLTGEEHIENKQTVLWPLYSFDVIPIELLSEIYQLFYHTQNGSSENQTYYTRKHLVTFLIDECLEWKTNDCFIKILDPSCGSGIFLVESYRRLVFKWIKQNKCKPKFNDLITILKENIFGVDINLDAIRIATLSLYLTLCDNLEPRDIWNEVVFETLLNKNLIHSDFFAEDILHDLKFDIIIGNPPWESNLTDLAEQYINKNDFPIGDNQFCQAFLWKVSNTVSTENTKICMLVASKPLLFNRRPTNKHFRQRFFHQNNVLAIYNFSIFRDILFENGAGPAVAILFTPNSENHEKIMYCSLKPSFTPMDDFVFSIDDYDVTYIDYEDALNDVYIWKIAMWGAGRDYKIIKKLMNLRSLEKVIEDNHWVAAQGYTKGKTVKKVPVPHFIGKPVVNSAILEKYAINENDLPLNNELYFHRYAKTNPEIFNGPHVLINEPPKRDFGILVTLLKNYAIFPSTMTGIHAEKKDLDELAKLCYILNSDIPLYFLILTSRNWLVERDRLQKADIMEVPLPRNFKDIVFTYDDLIKVKKV